MRFGRFIPDPPQGAKPIFKEMRIARNPSAITITCPTCHDQAIDLANPRARPFHTDGPRIVHLRRELICIGKVEVTAFIGICFCGQPFIVRHI